MHRNDWISLGATAALHLILLLLFAFLTASNPDAPRIGYMEVEFGPFSEGEPIEATEPAPTEAPTEEEEQPEEPAEEPEPEPEPEPTDPPEVDSPDETVQPTDEEEETETESEPETEPEEGDTDAEPQPDPDDGAEEDEVVEEGTTDDDPGDDETDERTAPYDIEGLDRDPQFAPMPVYDEQVNATVRIHITVDPQGNIIRRVPLQRGSPALDNAVMDALDRWSFNALPPGAPQENQTGIITFTFRLE